MKTIGKWILGVAFFGACFFINIDFFDGIGSKDFNDNIFEPDGFFDFVTMQLPATDVIAYNEVKTFFEANLEDYREYSLTNFEDVTLLEGDYAQRYNIGAYLEDDTLSFVNIVMGRRKTNTTIAETIERFGEPEQILMVTSMGGTQRNGSEAYIYYPEDGVIVIATGVKYSYGRSCLRRRTQISRVYLLDSTDT
ncbi:MAG: hypothetical protein AAF787_13850 [Chloroflexota bacterium]